MANSLTHALPFPVRGAKYTLFIQYEDTSGNPTDPSSPDTEISVDGAAFTDCTEEVTLVTGSVGVGYITLTASEMDAAYGIVLAAKGTGVRTTIIPIKPIEGPVVFYQVGGSIVSAFSTSIAFVPDVGYGLSNYVYPLEGSIILVNEGTGIGQARMVKRVTTRPANGVSGTFDLEIYPPWETTPSTDTGFLIIPTAPSASYIGAEALSEAAAASGFAETASDNTTNLPTNISTLMTRLSSVRAGYLDNLSAGAVALASALSTVGGNVAGIKAKTDNLPASPAASTDASSALSSYDPPTKTEMDTGHAALATLIDAVDALATAVKERTDNLPDSPAATGAQMDLVDAPNATALNAVADAVLTRDWTAIASWPARCALQAMRFLRNRWRITSGNELEVFEEDDTTVAWTAPVTREQKNAVTEVDPT